MRLSFRNQFILAPVVAISILILLVIYTVFELSNIKRTNDVTVHWEIVTDRIQTAIGACIRVQKMIEKLETVKNLTKHDDFFDYIEQTKILSNNLLNSYLTDSVKPGLRKMLIDTEKLLHNPEQADFPKLKQALAGLIPALEHQYKLFASSRRTAYITNHRNLNKLNSRMTTLLLSGLAVCIALVVILSLWGLYKTRSRLHGILAKVSSAAGQQPSLSEPGRSLGKTKPNKDELDKLEHYLSQVTHKLINNVSMENLLRGMENERKRIAMDMHDDTLADLTTLLRQLEHSAAESSANQEYADQLNQLREQVNGVITKLRQTINDLHPRVLEILGLESALEENINKLKAVPGSPEFHFDFDQRIEKSLSADQKLSVYRIMTEVINNVLKHAACSSCEISARQLSDSIVLTVEDNGGGMPENVVHGHGYHNIKERARLLGARTDWSKSRFSSGTAFKLVIEVSTHD